MDKSLFDRKDPSAIVVIQLEPESTLQLFFSTLWDCLFLGGIWTNATVGLLYVTTYLYRTLR